MKILVAAYTVLAIAAGARAAVQLSTHAGEAPVQYALSAAAAVVYLVLAVALRRPERWRTVALVAASLELIGVLGVGARGAAESDCLAGRDGVVGLRRGLRVGAARPASCGARGPERPSPDDACLADSCEDEVERPRHALEVERVHERLRVLRLPSAAGAHEAPQLRLGRPVLAAPAASGASGTAAARPARRRPPRRPRRRARGSARPPGRRRTRRSPSRSISARVRPEPSPARSSARRKSRSSPASQRPASLTSSPAGRTRRGSVRCSWRRRSPRRRRPRPRDPARGERPASRPRPGR